MNDWNDESRTRVMKTLAESRHYTDEEPEPTMTPSPSLERHERLLKTLAGLAQAADRLESRLEMVLLPEPTSPMRPEGEVASRDVEPRSSRLADQHIQALSTVQAVTRRLESLAERIDL